MPRIAKAAVLALLILLTNRICLAEDQNPKPVMSEDLSGCTLPHGTVVLPDKAADTAVQKGYLFRVADAKFFRDPVRSGDKSTIEQILDKIRGDQLGDVAFSVLDGGLLIAISARAEDLGDHYLHEFDGKELSRAGEKPPPPRVGRQVALPGVLHQAVVGHCYLLETVGGKSVLLRVIKHSASQRSISVQYVYQPNGSHRFQIPRGALTPIQLDRDNSVAGSEQKNPRTVPLPNLSNESTTDIHALLRSRGVFTQAALQIVMQPAAKQLEVKAKSAAILQLGQLRSREAVPVLINQILFSDREHPEDGGAVERAYPCVEALVAIDKPASDAALATLKTVRVPAETLVDFTRFDAELKSSRELLRIYLLARVIEQVEGRELASMLLKRQLMELPSESARNSASAVALRIIKHRQVK